MGLRIIDQYSLLHFSVGVIAYFWSMSFLIVIVLHILFEFIENTRIGMNLINTYFLQWWPGGKTHPDSLINRISDVSITGMGWIIAYYLDIYYKK
jgi:hypothetical protein